VAQETALHFSAVGGVPLTDMLRTYHCAGRDGCTASSGTRRYVIGGMAGWDLGHRFAIESGVLYRRFGYAYTAWGPLPVSLAFTDVQGTGASLEVPALLKVNLLHRRSFAPYLAAGAAWRRLVGLGETWTFYHSLYLNGNPTVGSEGSSDRPMTLRHRTAIGPTIAAGVEFRAHHLRIAPEVRYTRWHGDTLGQLGDPLRWNWQRVDFLLAIGF